MKFMKLGSKPDSFQTDGNDIRFVATELASDFTVNVGDIKFYLHKFPLLSKCARLQKLVALSNEESSDEVHIPDIPGGPAAFEICAKFCYGMTVTLNAYNVVAARCAAEYLEMDESVEKGNLIYKIEVFLNSSILRSWKDSVIVIQTTKSLLPWSEDLKLISYCIDSIASKACIDTSKVEWSYTYNRKKLPSENGIDNNWNGVRKQQIVPRDWWVEDMCDLDIDFYKRVITTIKAKGRMPCEVIGEALKAYTYRRVSGFAKGVMQITDVAKNQSLVETIISLLPTKVASVSCCFLLRLLRAACVLDCGERSKKDLINRIGYQLQEASVSDLLIPSPQGENSLYDVDLVSSILDEFLQQDVASAVISKQINDEVREIGSPNVVSDNQEDSKVAVAKLVDGYLAEIARDPNLPLQRFVDLAEMVPQDARPVHDGIYRAIDMFLKEHPGLSKGEKRQICALLDCGKLSVDARIHAVQNERLPLRVVVQVLFFEQLRSAASGGAPDLPASIRSLLPREKNGSLGSSRSAATTSTTEEDWDALRSVEDLKSIKSVRAVAGGGGGASGRSSGSGDLNKSGDDRGNKKTKCGDTMPKKILRKIWSSRAAAGAENSSSDTSESPGSTTVPEESKSTPPSSVRHSVS